MSIFLLTGSANASLNDVQEAVLKKDYRQAQRLAQLLLDGKPSPSDLEKTYYYLGLSHLNLGQRDLAREHFQLALKSNRQSPTTPMAHLGLIDVYYLEEKYDQALYTAEQFLQTYPQSDYLSLAYLKLGRIYLKLAQWEKARGYLNKVLHEFPQSPEAYFAKQFLEEKQYFAVQIGSFLERHRAEGLVNELKSKGEYAYIVATTDELGKNFYRVRIGEVKSLQEAQSLQTRISQLGYTSQIYP